MKLMSGAGFYGFVTWRFLKQKKKDEKNKPQIQKSLNSLLKKFFLISGIQIASGKIFSMYFFPWQYALLHLF